MRWSTVVLVLGLAGFLLPACASQLRPQDIPASPSEHLAKAKGPESGRASSDNQTNDIPIAGGNVMPGGRQVNNAITAKNQPSRLNTGSGHMVTAFVLGATAGQKNKARKEVIQAALSDPALKSIADEISILMKDAALDEVFQTRIDQLRAMYVKAREDFITSMLPDDGEKYSVDLGQVRLLVNIGIINGHVGHDERAPTNVEALAVASALPRVIKAAKGINADLEEGEQAVAVEETVNEILATRDLTGMTPEEVENTRSTIRASLEKLFAPEK